MILFGASESQRRLWLAETTGGALEIAARCPDIDDLLRFWAREIAKALTPSRIALFVIEGERWLRILPESQLEELPFVTEATLSGSVNAEGMTRVQPVRSGEPETVLVPYSARDGWRGVLMIWTRLGLTGGQARHAEDLGVAIGRSLTVLQKCELSREQAFAAERSRLASEIHDGHLQSLASAKLHAEVCFALGQSHPSPRLNAELARLHNLLTDTVREVRQFLLELRSPPVGTDQFLPWLRSYADDFSRENGIQVEMRVEGEGELPQTQVDEATRLVREALTNVRKHAKAASVRIVVALSEHITSISVSDDGVGFDVRKKMQELLDSSHNGLIGIRYRAESVGGEMRLRSEPGKGTTLLFRLPRPERRSLAEERRRKTPSDAAEVRAGANKELSPQRDTSVRDSIRSTLAEAIDSFLEQEASLPPSHERDAEL